jgi:cbb3-type cytochrome oxidase maturation protein
VRDRFNCGSFSANGSEEAMSVLLILIPLSLVVAALFLGAFIWAVRAGQYEDTCTPSMRVLADDGTVRGPKSEGFENQPARTR